MREQLVAWAGDCRVRGEVELEEGRLSDQINQGDLLTFHAATLESLDDGHEVALDELEVARRELHLVEVDGRQGDPSRRLRTIQELVELELGPFNVTGNIHRSPSAQPMAALTRWSRFVPVTDAVVRVAGRGGDPLRMDVVLVNRERVAKTRPLSAIPIEVEESWTPPSPAENSGD
jgi:hypothetical protein